jgi:hypothetical protein
VRNNHTYTSRAHAVAAETDDSIPAASTRIGSPSPIFSRLSNSAFIICSHFFLVLSDLSPFVISRQTRLTSLVSRSRRARVDPQNLKQKTRGLSLVRRGRPGEDLVCPLQRVSPRAPGSTVSALMQGAGAHSDAVNSLGSRLIASASCSHLAWLAAWCASLRACHRPRDQRTVRVSHPSRAPQS